MADGPYITELPPQGLTPSTSGHESQLSFHTAFRDIFGHEATLGRHPASESNRSSSENDAGASSSGGNRYMEYPAEPGASPQQHSPPQAARGPPHGTGLMDIGAAQAANGSSNNTQIGGAVSATAYDFEAVSLSQPGPTGVHSLPLLRPLSIPRSRENCMASAGSIGSGGPLNMPGRTQSSAYGQASSTRATAVATSGAIGGSSIAVPRVSLEQRSMSLPGGGGLPSWAKTRGGRAIPHRGVDFGMQAEDVLSGGNSSPGGPMGGSSGMMGSHPSSSTAAAGDSIVSRKASSSTISSLSTLARSTIVTTSRREPLVYPAYLSRVAQKFKERINLEDRVKNELTYKNSFTGTEAVDMIAYIIKTPDRNLALLLGRALDAQKFFHDVTYDSRLRDSPTEVYQFSAPAVGPPVSQHEPNQVLAHGHMLDAAASSSSSSEDVGVVGVFTLLAECYSPTCTRDKLCYSISCPRRLEQQARLNMKLDPGLQNMDSRATLQQVEDEQPKLWIYTVPPEIADTVPKEEQKRQEVIAEFIYTERKFVKALEYLRDFWMKPLRRSNIIPEARREKFLRTVFINILEILENNMNFAGSLTKLQQQNPVVEQIAPTVLENVQRFEPFIRYGAAQLYGKYEFEREKASNPLFAQFVEETERLPESKGLELNGYLSKPTTRLARYPLLLEAILKRTKESSPDYANIPVALRNIREFLTRVNVESGKAENRFALMQLNQCLVFRQGEYFDLKLNDDKRQLIYHGHMQKRPGESELNVYLFDNALLICKSKQAANKRDMLKVVSKPIPLELLRVVDNDESPYSSRSAIASASAASSFRKGPSMIRSSRSGDVFPLLFQHLGRRGYETMLYAPNFQARKAWVEQIAKQQSVHREHAAVYTQHVLQQRFFGPTMRVGCAKPFDGGRKIIYGTFRGLYVSDIEHDPADSSKRRVTTPVFVLQRPNISQLDVLEIYGIMLFLVDKAVYSLPLELLENSPDPVANARRAKLVTNQVTFYKVGECVGRTMLTVVKSHSLNSTVRIMEPTEAIRPQNKRPPLRRLLTSNQPSASEGFKLFKPAIEVPAAMISVSYLRNHLCMGCSRGFELLDLNTLKIESLLDPADTSLDFVIRKEGLRPISIYRIGKEFLLNFSDFSFFINRNGWRSRPDWIIQWEGVPEHIVLSHPYLIAFDTSFIEIRNMETELLRAVTGENIRFLHESMHEILYVHENEHGYDEIVAINFWEKQKRVEANVKA